MKLWLLKKGSASHISLQEMELSVQLLTPFGLEPNIIFNISVNQRIEWFKNFLRQKQSGISTALKVLYETEGSVKVAN